MFHSETPPWELVPVGSCSFVEIEQPKIQLISSFQNLNATVENFINDIIKCAELKFYSQENLLVETATYLALLCDIDIYKSFDLLMYLVHQRYIPWSFDIPKKRDIKNLDRLQFFKSLNKLLSCLDVKTKRLQCINCRTKRDCTTISLFTNDELELFTVQDPEPLAINNPIEVRGQSFIKDFDVELGISDSDNSIREVKVTEQKTEPSKEREVEYVVTINREDLSVSYHAVYGHTVLDDE